jgi:uncharacterized membrane protein YgcG
MKRSWIKLWIEAVKPGESSAHLPRVCRNYARAALLGPILTTGCGVGVLPVPGPLVVHPHIYHPYAYPVAVAPFVPYRHVVVVAPPVAEVPMVDAPAPVIVAEAPVVTVQPTVVVVRRVEPAVVIAEPASSSVLTDLEPLVAPIALYPDPLLGVLLPACTYPQQITQAAEWLANNPNPADAMIDAQPWEPAVKALVRYPTVLTQLNSDAQWTQSLGSAFSSDPAGVSNAIQGMRARAAAVGSLVNTPQITMVRDGGVIAIQPAVVTALFVPVYNPVVVYTQPVPLTYEAGYVTGPWLVNAYDWTAGTIYVGDWHGPYLYEGGIWHRDYYWRAERYHYWHHEERFGPAPRLARENWAHPGAIRAREAEFHRNMERSRPMASQQSTGRSTASANGAQPRYQNNAAARSGQPQRGTAQPNYARPNSSDSHSRGNDSSSSNSAQGHSGPSGGSGSGGGGGGGGKKK